MTSAVTGVSIRNAPAFPYGGAAKMSEGDAAGGAGDVQTAASARSASPDADGIPAIPAVQVSSGFLNSLLAGSPNSAPAPAEPAAGWAAEYSVNAGASAEGAAYEGAGGEADGRSAPHRSVRGQTGDAGKARTLDQSAHIVPPWHIIPRMTMV
jgi:hypothetical protein